MFLSGEAINQKHLISGASDDGYRGASYDVHIGKIIDPEGNERDTYVLPAQGIVNVISRETVRIPNNVAGFAMVKTSLCNDGVLAINIGIIDPLYSSSVSSFLINFGKHDYALSIGQVFLRLTFFEYNPPTKLPSPPHKSVEEYLLDRKRTVLQHFSATFLDIDATTNRALDEAYDRYKRKLLFWVPAFVLVLTLFTFFLNFGNLLLVQRWLQPNDQTKAELLREQMDGQLRVLTDRMTAIQSELNSLRNSTNAPGARK